MIDGKRPRKYQYHCPDRDPECPVLDTERPSKMADGKQSESNERYVFTFVGVTVYLVATPPPRYLVPGDT